MPLFLSEEEFRLISHDASAVAEKADAFIRDLHRQVDTVRAEADAASIAAEQTCALLEQKYDSLADDLSRLHSENVALSASVEQRLAELAGAQAEKHQLHLKAIGKDGEIERLSMEVSELHKSKRQLLELLEQKDAEIREKNATIQSFLDKIVNLTDDATSKEARLHDSEAELARYRATCNRLSQEKELIEKHNTWLNEELTAKVTSLIELRKTHMDIEADLSAKLADLEKQFNECSSSLKWSKERVRELDLRVISLEEELCSSKDAAAVNEERFASEMSTVTKLVELYKMSSEEWAKKAGELEGVIKALEAHLGQVENEYKEKLDKEVVVRKECEKEAVDLKEKLEKCEAEIEKLRKANELSLIPVSSYQDSSIGPWIGETGTDNTNESTHMLVPKIPAGISGTALAASLLRDGWSLAKMYERYQEAADALRHEKWGRKHSEAILERVLHEIEEKAEIILDERAEHERMLEAYTMMNQKLQHALLEHDNFENSIRRLKAELKKRERDYIYAQKEIDDLQKQVTVLLKECRDVQLRCGTTALIHPNDSLTPSSADIFDGSDAEKVILEHLLTFKDINGLVEQNVQLRSLVRSLSCQEEKRDAELREGFQMELQKVTDEAAVKVEAVLKRSEEQGCLIESLHSSVAMYKRLYEEEHRIRASCHPSSEVVPDGKKDLMLLFESSQEVSKKSHEELFERARNLEEDLSRLRSELTSLRVERDKRALEANFARERLDSFMKEFDHQRQEVNAASARNVELTQLLVEYQKRLRESSDLLVASEENSRKLSMEVSILKHEREILKNSEERACDEVRSLSERVHRLQSSLDTIQSAEEVRENARATEIRKHEQYVKKLERDWAEVRKELQDERDRVRTLTFDREKSVENSMRQVEELGKELADAWRAVASAESRAAVAEARCSDLEAKIKCSDKKVIEKDGHDHSMFSTAKGTEEEWKTKDELEKLKEEARANKNYMLQYKEIAHTNEIALKQIESAHEEFKAEAEKSKKALEAEVMSLRNKVSELESNYILKSQEYVSALEAKEKALSSTLADASGLKDEIAEKIGQISALEIQVSSLKDDLDKEHRRWRTAQANYERQVILQSETIQELTNTSKELSILQDEISKLRKLSATLEAENDILKGSWDKERSVLQESKDQAERKFIEINEQNKILHTRLESLHIRLADKEHISAGSSSQSIDPQAGSDLQNVISYLRRSKEIAETEISLLKQEKLRLQSQLESALKASEKAQALLNSQRESSRAIVFTDEEFKSLQLQVREINLLRESNMQLREENKHNFEEFQKSREELQRAKVEAERFSSLSREKQLEIDACQKEVEMQRMEIGQLKSRTTELLESCKNIDITEYERMKDEFQQVQIRLRENEMELQLTRNLVSKKEESMLNLEQVLAKSRKELSEQEKKINDALQVEANFKLENDKQKKITSILKKKSETLTKEKDELSKGNQALQKQLEDFRSGKRAIGESSSEQALKEIEKEKDTRIQILEKLLENVRDDLRKERDDKKREKQIRQKNENVLLEFIQTVDKKKKILDEELVTHKHALALVLKSTGITAAQLPNESLLDEQASAYLLAIDNFEEARNSFLSDGLGSHSLPTETSIGDTSVVAAGRQSPVKQMRPSMPRVIAAEEREKRSNIPKPSTEARKTGRRLVRPRLEQAEEPAGDIEMSEMEGSTTTEDGKVGSSHERELSDVALAIQPSSARKRLASSSISELPEDSFGQEEASFDVAPMLKKSKGSESPRESEGQPIPSSSENHDAVEQSMPPSSENANTLPPIEDLEPDQALPLSNEEIVDATKNEEVDITTKDQVEEQQKLSLDGEKQEVQNEGDEIAEEFTHKASGVVELLDDCLRSEEAKDMPQSTVDSEDQREEGELVPDESEQQQEGGTLGDGQREPVPNDGADDMVETTSPEFLNEKPESTDVLEDVAEGSDKSGGNNDDHGALDIAQSPQTTSGVREGSPSTLPPTAGSEQQISNVVAETAERDLRSGRRTISITERARQNALLRQAGMAQPLSRGRGRAVGGFRKDGVRGIRGGRGGRGQGSGDREQG